MFARHVKNLSVSHVELRVAQEDFRPTVVLDSVADATFDGVTLPHASGVSTFLLRNTQGLTIRNCTGLPDRKREEAIIGEKL
jgi:hypothetical protein